MSDAQAADLFRTSFGTDPEGVWEAPGRVNLIGEHVDYQDGLVLPVALPQRTWVAARRRGDERLRVVTTAGEGLVEVNLGEVAPGVPAGWAGYPAGVVWALRQASYPVSGMDLAVHSTVPIGAGLSSSAALEGAVGAAASDLYGLGLLGSDQGRAELAGWCQRAENEIAQAPTGGMDQAAALRAIAGHALLLDCRDQSLQQVPFDLDRYGQALLVIDTRVTHALGDGQYGNRRAACEQAARLLGVRTLREVSDQTLAALRPQPQLRRRARHVVSEIQRVRDAVTALRAGDLAQLGVQLIGSHRSLRDDFEVSCPELDLAVDTCLAQGAWGARMTGGGFGGSAIALVGADAVQATSSAVRRAFVEHGYREPRFFVATAACGARRSR